jgi:hypothetical protein
MPTKQELFQIAVLDDYQNVTLSMANWSVLDGQATVTVFNDHLNAASRWSTPVIAPAPRSS